MITKNLIAASPRYKTRLAAVLISGIDLQAPACRRGRPETLKNNTELTNDRKICRISHFPIYISYIYFIIFFFVIKVIKIINIIVFSDMSWYVVHTVFWWQKKGVFDSFLCHWWQPWMSSAARHPQPLANDNLLTNDRKISRISHFSIYISYIYFIILFFCHKSHKNKKYKYYSI